MTRLALIRNENPLGRLERLTAWWRGKATVRIEEANRHPDHSAEHRRNLEIAVEYEKRAQAAGMIA